MSQSGLNGLTWSAKQGTLSDDKLTTDDKRNDEAGVVKAKKNITIKERDFRAVIWKDEIIAKTANVEQEIRKVEVVPNKADRVLVTNKLRRQNA
jgi:hypothetical protein